MSLHFNRYCRTIINDNNHYNATGGDFTDKYKFCAILGHSPMRFKWGFDEEDIGCKDLKLEMLQQILSLRMQGATQFGVACDPGVGLYAAEMINILREKDPELQLYCYLPFEEQATKWASYLRERYFSMLEKCTYIIPVGKIKTPGIQLDAYKSIIDQCDVVLAIYDQASFRGDDVDQAVAYAHGRKKQIIIIHPDSLDTSTI